MVARLPHPPRVARRHAKTATHAAPDRRDATGADPICRAALQAALHPVITIDSHGTILTASESTRRVFGFQPVELVGSNVAVLINAPQKDEHDTYLQRYISTGLTTILNHPARVDAVRKDGSIVPIELSVSRAKVPGRNEPVFVGIIRDMSDQAGIEHREALDHDRLEKIVNQQTRALQEAHLRLRMADRMASIGTLAAGLGHDMNNVLLPVRAHLNALGAAGDDLTPQRRRDHVEKILKGIAYLQQLADGLHFLTMDPEKQHDPRATTCLESWWAQTGTLIAKAVPTHVRVTVSFPPGLPEIAVAPHRLTQAVLNLVVNAGEAIPVPRKRKQGLVRISARASPDLQSLTLVVADNGIGMTDEVRRRAFEVFFTTKPRDLGTGLGLALVRKVAESSGGQVEIESAPEKGTRIIMTLPAMGTPCRPCNTLIALVTVADDRTRALIGQLLDGAGAHVHFDDAPDHADIWVLDPVEKRLEDVEQWRRCHPAGQLVLLQKPDTNTFERWNALGPVVIQDRNEFEQVQSALRWAVAAI